MEASIGNIFVDKIPPCYACNKQAHAKLSFQAKEGIFRPEVSIEFCEDHAKQAQLELGKMYGKTLLRIAKYNRLAGFVFSSALSLLIFLVILRFFPPVLYVLVGITLLSGFIRAFRLKSLTGWSKRSFGNKTIIFVFSIIAIIDFFNQTPPLSEALNVGLLVYYIFI